MELEAFIYGMKGVLQVTEGNTMHQHTALGKSPWVGTMGEWTKEGVKCKKVQEKKNDGRCSTIVLMIRGECEGFISCRLTFEPWDLW